MSPRLEQAVARLQSCPEVLRGGSIGIEKESLRVTRDGFISAVPHPSAFGSALTNRYITTDYSEALLEFVTPPVTAAWEAIQFLCDIHALVHESLGEELLWALSMPCVIRSERDIPLARYGASNIGRMKTIYRRGLGYRYGRYMQAISGIHFNYSLPETFWPVYCDVESSGRNIADLKSEAYLALTRNVRRLDWMLLYLFGSSPAVCKSFMAGVETGLDELDAKTWYGPHATSLRMSDIGYQNAVQAELDVSANSLDEYIDGLRRATRTPCPEYEKIGIRDGDRWLQLSTSKLQIENEYYSTIRPKRVARSGEQPSSALRRGGVEYVELRALDVSPFDPVGINGRQVRFLEVFLIYCLLADSPLIGESERAEQRANRVTVARRGREPGLTLRHAGADIPLAAWGRDICAEMAPIAAMLDAPGQDEYQQSVMAHQRVIEQPDLAPSARLLAELGETRLSLYEYGMSQSAAFREYFQALDPALNRHRDLLLSESRVSAERQAEIERTDELPFEDYLHRYLEQA